MAKISLLSGNGNQTTITGISLALSGHFISSGILKKDYLLVTENDTPNNTVKVDIGAAVIGFDDYTGDQDKFYYFFVDTPENVTIGANSSGNPRIDAIVAYVDTANPASDDNDGAGVLIAIEGTPAGSPSAPTDSDIQTELGAGVRWIRLANVEVSNGFSSIVDGDITDTRVKARATGNSIYDNNDAVKGYDSGGSIRDLLKLNSGDNIEIGGAGIGNINLNNTLVSNIINSLGGIIWDGWQPAGETWTYASANSFTISGDHTNRLYKGAWVRLTQATGGTKYFIIDSTSFGGGNTTVNLVANTTHSLANEAITAPFISYANRPAGAPAWLYTSTYKADTDQSTSTANAAVVNFNRVLFDPSGNYDVANLRWTVPISGLYLCSAQIAVGTAPGDGQRYGPAIRQGGSVFSEARAHTGVNQTVYASTTTLQYLTAGQFIDVIFSATQTATIITSSSFSFVTAKLLVPGTNAV